MKKEEGIALVEALGAVATNLHEDTGAPVVIVLCMSAISGGSVLSACYGPRGPEEVATALRFAADHTDDADSIHLDKGGGAKA